VFLKLKQLLLRMKILALRFVAFCTLSLVFVLSSCKEDIDLASSYIENPNVFCLLDPAENIHFVKLTRTFSSGSNALVGAQIADSSYYADADVQIDEVQKLSNGTEVISRSWTLTDTIITGKQPGVFYGPDQKVYYFKTPEAQPLLNASNYTYKLKIILNGGEYSITGETAIVQDVSISSGASAYKFRAIQSGVESFFNQNLKGNVGNAGVLNGTVRIGIREIFGSTPVDKEIVWNLGDRIGADLDASQETWIAFGETFYDLIKTNCTNDATITKRQLLYIDFDVTGGSKDLAKYILVNKPTSALAQSKPAFTNLIASDGRKVLGLFSSRFTASVRKTEFVFSGIGALRSIDQRSMSYLCISPVTGSKLFCSSNAIDAVEPFFCD
jgi:hypothetical protein